MKNKLNKILLKASASTAYCLAVFVLIVGLTFLVFALPIYIEKNKPEYQVNEEKINKLIYIEKIGYDDDNNPIYVNTKTGVVYVSVGGHTVELHDANGDVILWPDMN